MMVSLTCNFVGPYAVLLFDILYLVRCAYNFNVCTYALIRLFYLA